MNYETCTMHPDIKFDTDNLTAADHPVEKMKFAYVKDPATNKSVADKTTVSYSPASPSATSPQKTMNTSSTASPPSNG